MPQRLGAHNERIAFARALLTKKGRIENNAFSFEGATLLDEAVHSGIPIHEVYATERAYETTPLVHELESSKTVYLVDERTFTKISDLESPSGILTIAGLRLRSVADILRKPGVTLVLADINDPGNAGALMRSAEAFGASGAVFGNLGVEPYHPKVVRSAMGTIFRLPLAVTDPEALRSAAESAGASIIGLAAGHAPIGDILAAGKAPRIRAVIVGHERHGLGRWESLCEALTGILMQGPTESLNAAVAGSIALYELAKADRT